MPRCFAGLSCCVLAVAWLTACATAPPPLVSPPAPDVRLSPVYDLFPGETVRDKVAVVIDNTGLAHVLIASTRRKEVHHVVVGPEGVVARELVRSATSPDSLSAVFDEHGVLHVLLDCHHLIRQDGAWRAGDPPPWELAGFEPLRCWFVRDAPRPTWAFLLRGGDVGAPERWDWYIAGGAPAGIVWPWHTQASKLVVVVPTADVRGRWFVLDPMDNFDASNVRTLADERGEILVLYDAIRGGLSGVSYPRLARLRSAPSSGATGERDALPGSRPGVMLQPVKGQALLIGKAGFGPDGLGNDVMAARDPHSGTALVVQPFDGSRLLRGTSWSAKIPLPITHFWKPRLAPAGNERFHAMVIGEAGGRWTGKATTVLYLVFADGRWSGTVDIGLADVSSFWGSIWDAVEIGSSGGRRALAVWPTPDGIVGRWIE
jgi:hypothetical protein